MNRIDRLFGIVLRVQGRRVRAEELAETFEVSKRTIYRDILALHGLGVPIVSLPGQGYEMMEGYFLPPLVFTREEATALLLGARLLGQQATDALAAGARTAVVKLAAALPDATRRDVELVGETITFYAPAARFDLDHPRLAILRSAVTERRVVRMRYHGRARDTVNERDVEPLQLTYAGGDWYLQAFCRLRQGLREFRLDRIESLDPLAETFSERRPDIAADDHRDGAAVEVRVRMTERAARWVRERQHYAFVDEQPAAAAVVMRYRVNDVDELVPWLRGWGTTVQVLSPPELRARLRDEARALAELLA